MLSLSLRFLFALLVGAIVGLERESSRHGDDEGSAGGIRTYALVSLLGALAGFFYLEQVSSMLVLLTAFVGVLVLIYYALGSYLHKRLGMTSEISVLLTFVLGFLAVAEIVSLQILVILVVVTLLVLSIKSHTRKLASGVSGHEVQSFISYALIALVILPLLPNTAVTFSHVPFLPQLLGGYGIELGQFANVEIFNPRKIWFIVALVTGIDVFGYILGKLVGSKKSFTLTSFVAGFISSTSATSALAQKSKKNTAIHTLLGAALLANLASFFQVFLLVGPINAAFLVKLTPTLLAIILAAAAGVIYFFAFGEKKNGVSKNDRKENQEERKIYALKPAIKFAGILILVKFITKVCLILFGDSGFMVSSVIASVAGLDAIIINLADLAGKSITFETAILTFILVNATNLLSKSFYAFWGGSRSFAAKFLASVVLIISLSFVGFLFG